MLFASLEFAALNPEASIKNMSSFIEKSSFFFCSAAAAAAAFENMFCCPPKHIFIYPKHSYNCHCLVLLEAGDEAAELRDQGLFSTKAILHAQQVCDVLQVVVGELLESQVWCLLLMHFVVSPFFKIGCFPQLFIKQVLELVE